MAQNQEQSGGTLAQQMFGPQAGVYAQSKVHISDDSLESIQKLTGSALRQAQGDGERAQGDGEEGALYQWTVDIGTGAGFTRLCHVRSVRARDRIRHHAANAAPG